MNNKYLNVRIGVEFYNKLTTHKAFELNWKAISPAFFLLQRIACLNDMSKGKAVEFYSGNIRETFRPYCDKDKGDFAYYKYLTALKELGLLQIHKVYVVGDSEGIEGHCNTYLVTSQAIDLLSSSNVEYLKALHSNKEVIHKNKDNIRKRMSREETYSDYVLSYIHDGLKHFEYDYPVAMNMISGSGWEEGTKQSAEVSLINFDTKDFTKLKYNNADGRVFNEFVAMKSDLRKCFTYKNMNRKAIIDIRSCWPTFFSSYVLDLFTTCQDKKSLLSILPFPYHYVVDNVLDSNKCKEFRHITDTYVSTFQQSLEEEHKKWLALFTNPNLDPRNVIGSTIDRTKDEVKEALNSWINGNKVYARLDSWILTNFPCLYAVWQTTDVKTTGVNISKSYECRIMLHSDLYKLTEAQGIKVGYEYDGFSIFSSDCQSLLVSKVDYLAKAIKQICKKQFGIDLVLKIELL